MIAIEVNVLSFGIGIFSVVGCWTGLGVCIGPVVNYDGNNDNQIDVNLETTTITLSMSEQEYASYHATCINNDQYELKERIVLTEEIVEKSSGLRKKIFVEKGIYTFQRINGKIIMQLPFKEFDINLFSEEIKRIETLTNSK